MKKIILIVCIILALTSQRLLSANAPISTIGTVVSSGTTAMVPITAINFTNIGSCNLVLLYNHTIVTVDSVTIGPLPGGNISTNLTKPDTISLGWYIYPGVTLPDNSVIFKIYFKKVIPGTSAITFHPDNYSCVWYDGDFNYLPDTPYSTYYLNGSVTFVAPLVADFTADNTTPPDNTTVHFTDLTTGGPTSWDWSFNRTSVIYVNGTNDHSQNPQVQFTEGGLYTVTLVAHNAYFTDTKVKTGYIRAGTPGLWIGDKSTEWSELTNWDNWLVPVGSTDVVIPSVAPFWPVYTGDLIVGSTCKTITMNGSSEMSVSGNFTINTGHSLTFTGSGTLKVGGNWSDSGSFITGTGSVEFFGPDPGSILAPATETFYNLIENKTTTTLTILHTVIVNGDLLILP